MFAPVLGTFAFRWEETGEVLTIVTILLLFKKHKHLLRASPMPHLIVLY
jgi:hypothetical protein